MASPYPEPTAIKQLKGTKPRRKNSKEPQPGTDLPSCPDHLSPNAKLAWDALVPELTRIGVLTKIDINAFTRYCQQLADWRKCHDFRAAHGDDIVTTDPESGVVTGVVPNGYAKKQREIEVLLLRYETEFGMTPSSRSRITTSMVETADEFSKLLTAPMRISG